MDYMDYLFEKVPKIFLGHLEVFTFGKRKARFPALVEKCVLEEYGPDLHPALRSREGEVQWLRDQVDAILPLLLPSKYISCKLVRSLVREILACAVLLPALDAAADPDHINALMSIVFQEGSPDEESSDLKSRVVLLEKFVERRSAQKAKEDEKASDQGSGVSTNQHPLGIELKTILNVSHLSFQF